MKYNTILLDFDDTLVDFYDAEDKAFHNMAKHYHHYPTAEDFQFFKQINQAHWEAFQKNKLTKDEVLSHRFIEYFNHYGIEVDGKQADVTFRDELAKAPIKHFDSTLETIDRLAQNNKLYIVTNGVTDTQKLGGKNAGIATCWFNVRNKKNNSGINPDYEIKSLRELVDLIENE
ncbi:HAD hydrolase-like protein [Staphylococcus haemolyticus]|nr:HAD hydrolase-like protein [Staphylococcus haemolyticus]